MALTTRGALPQACLMFDLKWFVTHFKMNDLNLGWSTLNGILGAKNFLSCQKLILIGQTISLKRNNFYELIYPISEHFLSNILQDQNFFKNCLFLGTFLVKRDIRGKIS